MEVNSSNTTCDRYGLTKDVLACAIIIVNIVIIFIQILWIIYFGIKIQQNEKIHNRLVHNGYQHDDTSLFSSHRNKLLLYRYLLINVTSEMLTLVLVSINTTIRSRPMEQIIDRAPYSYLYVKYVAGLIQIVFSLCILEMLNLTTLFVKDVYLRNSTHSGMRKKINRFIMRFLLLLALGVSGIGLGIACILCEVFLIIQLVLYYRYSRQLYRSLGMHYEDTKYEFGDTSIEARTALKHKKRYRWSAIWYFIVTVCIVVDITMLVATIPLQFMNEKFIEQRLTENNITFTHSDIYYDINIANVLVSSGLYFIITLMYLPIYVIFSMYYLCDRFLFVRIYRHRFHVNDKYEIESLVQPLIQ